ncbi:MAG: hypothetical protein E7166_03290 [Firmicutes bacterium]|nr:hypothetical protein [Bacillota bacterium]
MKININYDLFDKIRESKTGISLNRNCKFILPKTAIATTIYSLLNITSPILLEKTLKSIPVFLILYSLPVAIVNKMMAKDFKYVTTNQLKDLSLALKNIGVSTNYDLLIKSEKYKTNYKIYRSESKAIYIKQDKYINVPICDNGEIKNISIVQEHIMGSKKYTLSCGSPKKVLKLAYNPT